MTDSTGGPGRVLALDYGSARCGCAVSDPSGTIATPLEPIEDPGTETGLERIASLARDVEAAAIVVGLPVGLSGSEGEQAEETRRFAARVAAAVPVPVETHDERFTTRLSARTPGSASEHSRAAAHLLSSYLAARVRRATG